MDGCFCPQLTVGAPYVKGLRTPLLKDVHLMVREPLGSLADYVAAGADIVTVHVEAAVHIHRVLQRLGGMEHSAGPGRGIVRGLALNPGTPAGVADAAPAGRGGNDLALGHRSGLERAEILAPHAGTGRTGQRDGGGLRQGHPGLRRRRHHARQHRRRWLQPGRTLSRPAAPSSTARQPLRTPATCSTRCDS